MTTFPVSHRRLFAGVYSPPGFAALIDGRTKWNEAVGLPPADGDGDAVVVERDVVVAVGIGGTDAARSVTPGHGGMAGGDAVGSPPASTPGREVLEALIARREYEGVPLVVAVSEDVPLADDDLLLWGIFTRFDAARDTLPARTERRGAWLTCAGPLGVDATWKPGYPDPVGNTPEIVAKMASVAPA